MNGLYVSILVAFAVVVLLWFRHRPAKSKKSPRQEPSIDRRDEQEEFLHVSPEMAARAQAAQSKPLPQAVPALRGATRVSVLPPPEDYSKFEEPTFLRRNVQLSFA